MTLSIRNHTTFDGPNVWSRFPVTHFIVDSGPIPQPLHNPSGLTERFGALSALVQQDTSLQPFPMPESDQIGEVLARLALNLQRIAGVSVEFSFGRRHPAESEHDVVVQHHHKHVGLAAGRLAVRWLAHLLDPSDSELDLVEAFQRFTVVVATNDQGVMGRAIAVAAARRGIPQTAIDPRGRIVEFGNGRYRKRLNGASTSRTPSIGVEISRDKYLTNRYLREAGLPVPESATVRSLNQALAAARTIGYPVAIKPVDQGDAIGVMLDLRNEDQIRASFDIVVAAASSGTGRMVVERFIPGNDYRILVVDDQVISARERIRPRITGDGKHTVQQLVDLENANPQRGTRPSDVYKKIVIDEQVAENLARLGLTLDDVPDFGQRIELKLGGHRRDGALHVDCTHLIHPENLALLRTATKVIGLDIAGIDVIAPDIAEPLWERGGAIIEINDSPAFNLHLFPAHGLAQDPSPFIMDMLFPPGQPVRVPVVAVMAAEDSGAVCAAIAQALADRGQMVGVATRDGVTIGGMRYAGVEGRNPHGPRTVLNNPTVEVAVVEVEAESIVEHGLGFGVCDVAIVRSRCGLLRPDGRPVETVVLDALDEAGVALANESVDEVVHAVFQRIAEVPGSV